MIEKKILIIGGSGLLGKKLVDFFNSKNYKVYSTYFNNVNEKPNFFNLDITDKKNVSKLLNKIKPEIIINCSAYTDVDECEKNIDKAFSINANSVGYLAEIVKTIDAKFVQISTDYVFNGKKGFYKEIDETNPINYYGLTKLKGEQIVCDLLDDFIIARTSVIYGINKNNFVLWMINNLKENKQINIVDDQFISPTYNTDITNQIYSLIINNENGIFHTAGGERISRYDFAIKLSEIFSLNKDNINKISMKDLKWVAKRPMDSSLDVSKISKFKKPYTINESLQLLKKELRGD